MPPTMPTSTLIPAPSNGDTLKRDEIYIITVAIIFVITLVFLIYWIIHRRWNASIAEYGKLSGGTKSKASFFSSLFYRRRILTWLFLQSDSRKQRADLKTTPALVPAIPEPLAAYFPGAYDTLREKDPVV
ncbi:hypothetical protein Moror_9995 [Moniliophthora roreri MCA 2997]|uniref:Uncharacterized protein n=2 Tax=Moniliophthora roreri TaxID=221103 RepID=V2WVM8_MONRO|nr:hypothetical protein Moror_9995 [Moniliophthora roreri MCA 2997]